MSEFYSYDTRLMSLRDRTTTALLIAFFHCYTQSVISKPAF